MIQQSASENILNFDAQADRIHVAFSPTCPNFRSYLDSHYSSNSLQQFLFLSGDEKQIPASISSWKMHYVRGQSPLFSELSSASVLHLHWSFEPRFLQSLSKIIPRCFVLISYLVDDYHTSRNLPNELIGFADELVLADIPLHLTEGQNSSESITKIRNPERSGTLNTLPEGLGSYQARAHIFAHPAVGSIIHSSVDAEDPRLSEEFPGGSWFFKKIFPDLNLELEQSMQSPYPDRALEADEILRSNARILLDLGLEKFQAEFSQDPYLRYLLALCLVELGQFDRSDYLLGGAFLIEHSWRARLLLGQIHSIRGDINRATDHFSNVLAEYPECKPAKEALRKLLLPAAQEIVLEEGYEPVEPVKNSDPKRVLVLSTFDSELFNLCLNFFRILLRPEAYIACKTANEIYQRSFALTPVSLSAIQLILCDEATPYLESFLERQVDQAVIVNNSNFQSIQNLSTVQHIALSGSADLLPETFFFFTKKLKLNRMAFVEIPQTKQITFERLDIQNPTPHRFGEQSKKFIGDLALQLNANEQSELDFYRRALNFFPDLQRALKSDICPEILQVILQKDLKSLCLICTSVDYVSDPQALLHLSNERLHRQAVLIAEIYDSPGTLENALRSESKRTALMQFNYILLSGFAQNSLRVKKILVKTGIPADRIVLTCLNSFASNA